MTSDRCIRIMALGFVMWNSRVAMADDKICYQCASPNLQNNWAITGLPLRPSTLKYDELCKELGDPAKELVTKTCSSSCFELLLPENGEYDVVRGCHSDFVWDEFKVTTNLSCHMTLVKTIEGKDFYAGTNFCPPVATIPCNKQFKTDDIQSAVDNENCRTDDVHTCKSCSEYDGSGSCSPSTTGTCKGVFCTKTAGTLNGGTYESRGCASFNPIGSNVCSWTDQTYNVSTGVDMALFPPVGARKKRAISMPFRANQCYCQGELCNSSPRFSTFLLSLFTVSFLVFS
ncbi:hypothetical protein CRE_26083 [Caenorhabditis remanei]|uniref:Uncharacterized protein n=1 Tax=Caenorhabditis remanei TaxID=31234 RepID=E3LRM2_CAERE|nr:hypothetical protein CRE_26083 [Caenorhabditis remanei]